LAPAATNEGRIGESWRSDIGGQRGYIFGNLFGDEGTNFSKNVTSLTPSCWWYFLKFSRDNLKIFLGICCRTLPKIDQLGANGEFGKNRTLSLKAAS
jgi:hypothetical protein